MSNASCTAGTCTRGRATTLQSMPVGRGNAASVVHGGKLYVFGGLDPARVPTNSTYVFDGTVWSNGAPFPEPRQMATAAVLADGGIALVSGVGPSSTDFGDGGVRVRVDVYSPATNTWSRMPDLPSSHAGACIISRANGEVLVIGGQAGRFDDSQTRAAARWKPDAGAWFETPDALLVARGNSSCGVLADGGILLAGGIGASVTSYNTDTVEVLNPDTLTSVLAPALPLRRSMSTAGVLPDGRVLLFGGWDATSTFERLGTPHAEAWLWRNAMPAETMTPLPGRIYGTASGFSPDGGLWVAGGLEKVGTNLYPSTLATTSSWSY